MPRTLPSQVLRFIASTAVVALLTAHPATATQQKTVSPQSQAQLQERIKTLEKQFDEADQKAASTAKELEVRLNAAEQKAASASKEEKVATPPAILAFIAICVSGLTLWKGHFARFSPLALAGNLRHRVYPIRNSKDRWFITSFDIPVSVTNPGARPGRVTGLRLRLHYPDVPLADNHEFVHPKWELKPDKVNCIGKDRFKWIDEAVAADWSPFIILPKATAAKHLVFEAKWHNPVVQTRVSATLEVQTDWRTKWLTVAQWTLILLPQMWTDLENGNSMGYFPVKGQVPLTPDCSPADLHKHTRTKEPLPAKGAVQAAESSYLDYPNSRDD
jgi:hypothetical protein